ncbi:hypothetical protein HMPREF3213_03457 [Heyndrickxia coagulans]|uniref:Uncharacterized protein n=1 Tax=Heyndrickxia coagulans TaxID=1398 RepID=A0A0C5CQG7_HEYCO|nr:hypothetical protein SB48_HM08orf04513 [Heyndrickxia coagulans]KWZ77268.1 hypothetical protein HMPREF3213_03457 [Heyndrickxia coagulans]
MKTGHSCDYVYIFQLYIFFNKNIHLFIKFYVESSLFINRFDM